MGCRCRDADGMWNGQNRTGQEGRRRARVEGTRIGAAYSVSACHSLYACFHFSSLFPRRALRISIRYPCWRDVRIVMFCAAQLGPELDWGGCLFILVHGRNKSCDHIPHLCLFAFALSLSQHVAARCARGRRRRRRRARRGERRGAPYQCVPCARPCVCISRFSRDAHTFSCWT